jgi:chromosome segregation ATPase
VAKPVNTATADPQRAQQQRVLVELNTRVQTLQGELSDLERERNAVKANSRYGDPNRAQTNEELGVMSGMIDRKQQELAAARAELAEAVERFNRASVIK